MHCVNFVHLFDRPIFVLWRLLDEQVLFRLGQGPWRDVACFCTYALMFRSCRQIQ